nr:hypothetical protein B0A51_16210 [Rachicladosporium sp. CCFEE 5018]
MSSLDGHGILSIIETAFFSPILLLSIFLCLRHGFRRESGWLYLLLLSLLHLIGSACLLYSETQHSTNKNLYITYYVCNSVGTAPLLLLALFQVMRINTGMQDKGMPRTFFRPVQLISLVALIVAIVGSTDFGSSNPKDAQQGATMSKVSAALFLVVYVAIAAITLLTLSRSSHVLAVEHKLLYACVAALPFLLVRIVYSAAVGFTSSKTSPFYRFGVSIWVQAFMQFAMEAVIVIMFMIAGLLTPKADEQHHPVRGQGGVDVEMETGRFTKPGH